ncbi:MAG: UDP-N-acetylmuramate dehydrogenase [Ruminococcaceae bacterium]|nr:UDP-N-acetylmuramate dehydrogenase [Oscillospiraceae bacterium]
MDELSLITKELRAALPELKLSENEPLSRHTSFRIGGPCAALIQPKSEAELLAVCRFLREKGAKPLVIGNGSNILAEDGFIPRLILQIGEGLSRAEALSETRIRAGSGILLGRLALFAASLSLTGLEFAHGIPGTLGGAVSMNAGAYGGEMKDVLRSARYLNGELELCESDELQLSYRHSRFSDTDDILLSADMDLRKGDESVIRATMKSLMERRKGSQPLDIPSAGSTFKRPVGGYAAALIDEAGLKGFAIGGAQVSEKHAGFVVNRGGASCEDVKRLMAHIQAAVFQRSGITLEPEVKLITEKGSMGWNS